MPLWAYRHPPWPATNAGQTLPYELASQLTTATSSRPSRWNESSLSRATITIYKSAETENVSSSTIDVTDETNWHWYHNDAGNDDGAAGVRKDMKNDALIVRRQWRKITGRDVPKMEYTAQWETNQFAS